MSDALKTEFILHPQLKRDTFLIGSLQLSDILLMNDTRYPWLILVPRQTEIVDITDLSAERRAEFIEEINQVASVLKEHYKPDRLNIAMLGNIVPQLHCHLIARFQTDFAWPKPVWGIGEAGSYPTAEQAEVISLLQNLLLA